MTETIATPLTETPMDIISSTPTTKDTTTTTTTITPPELLSIPGAGWSNNTTLYPHTLPGLTSRYSQSRRYIQLNTSWTRIGSTSTQFSRTTSTSLSGKTTTTSLASESQTARSLISQLCEKFYNNGWATGTGGGISIRCGGPSEKRPWRVFVAPSGIQKEDMIGDDVFELDMNETIISPPKTPGLRLSACTPLWFVVYRHRPSARAVIHTHSMNAQLATMLDVTEKSDVLKVTHLEMLKGVGHHAYDDVLEVPIIDNRPTEDLLAEQLECAIRRYPECNAVLVRRHGLYVWGDSWEQAKTQCESFDYLFESCIKMRSMGVDFSAIPTGQSYRVDKDDSIKQIKRTRETTAEEEEKKDAASPSDDTTTATTTVTKKQKVETSTTTTTTTTAASGFNAAKGVDNADDFVLTPHSIPLLPRHSKMLLLDIEGCTTAISFVKDVLFPYVLANLDKYVDELDDASVQEVLDALQADVTKIAVEEVKTECEGAVATEDKKAAVKAIVKILVKNDVKATGLKSLQGKMWKSGYESGELKGHIYPDFQPLLTWCQSQKISVNIYSSGSIAAQKLLFSKSTGGDLTPFLDNYFDTTSGGKKEASSYKTIAKSLNVDVKDIIFVSDAEGELVAAREAGVGHAVMSVREGNAPLTEVGREFPRIFSLLQLCGV